MKIITTGLLLLHLAWQAQAGMDNLELSNQEQAAVVSALMSTDGFAGTNCWILIKADKTTSGVERVTMWTKTAKNLPDAMATNRPPELYATIQFSRWNSNVHYTRRDLGSQEMQTAIQKGVAFLAKQGWLPAGFWLTCDQIESEFHLFFWTEPNRWPGDHCSMTITDSSLEYMGGR